MTQNPRDLMTQQQLRRRSTWIEAIASREPTSQSEEQAQTAVAESNHRDPKSVYPECADLRAKIEELRVSRDIALFAVAKERELLQALRSKYSISERFVRTAREPPLRYIVTGRDSK